jgi:hypothetical protein
MPFANKFKHAMAFPAPGDVVGNFAVEEVEVSHRASGYGRYEYPITIVLRGKGGQQGVRKALRSLCSARVTTFSGYGNPYQLSIGKLEISSAGQGRYRVFTLGIGRRVFLKQELLRFLRYLADSGRLQLPGSGEEIANAYLEQYQVDARRKQPKRRRARASVSDSGTRFV